LLDEWNNQGNAAAKIVVVSSCAETLTWFNRAFTGLGISSSLCTRYNDLGANTIQSFVSDPTIRILLITPSAIQTKIVLPPSSHTIVNEAVVFDVKEYIFRKIKTVGDDTLCKTILVAQNTIEEQIVLEPHFDDYFNSYDQRCTFVGPRFIPNTDVERMASLIDNSFVHEEDLLHQLEGGGEDGEG
jgi:hypothetical protein